MTNNSSRVSAWRRYRTVLTLLALLLAIGLWWLFRPERLFINQQVDETAPAGIAAIQPVFTGSLHSIGEKDKIQGRVNVVKNGNRLQLEIPNLESKARSSFTVALASSADSMSAEKTLGTITIAGHEKLAIPSGLDLTSNKMVLLTDESHNVLAKATLESF